MPKLPDWLCKLAEKYDCPQCEEPIKKEDIISIGVRESSQTKHGKKDVFFFEYCCHSCQGLTVFELDFTDSNKIQNILNLDELDLSEVPQDKPIKSNSKSAIRDDEVNQMKAFLATCKYYDDFLMAVGIDKYGFKDK